MKETIKKIFDEDYGVHSAYDRKISLNLSINSKGEIITAHRNNIQFYSSEFYNIQNKIIIEDKIRDLLLIDDDIILATKNGKIIRYKRDGDFEYSKYKEKIIAENINFRHIIKLDKKNLICAFSLSNIYIINLDSFSINSNFLLPEKLYIDPKTKPFILSHKNHTICFRQQKSITIFNYKKMKIIKTIDLSNDGPFQLFKGENENFLYVISTAFSKRKNQKNSFEKELMTYIQSIKFDLNLNILEKSKTKINMPLLRDPDSENLSDEDEEKEESEKYNYIAYWDHYCIYRCIVQNIKDYSFILHGYRGPPFEAEWFWLVKCKNGNIQEIKKKAYQYLSSESSYVDYVFIQSKNKIISAYTDKYNDEITFD